MLKRTRTLLGGCAGAVQDACDVAGLALAPATEPSLFAAADIADGIASTIGDIRDFATVRTRH